MREENEVGLSWNLFWKVRGEIAGILKISFILLGILLLFGIVLGFLKSGLSFFLELMSAVPVIGIQPIWVKVVLMGLILVLAATAIKIKGDILEKSQKHFKELSYTERKIIVIRQLSEILFEGGYKKVVKVHTWPGISFIGFTHEKVIPKLAGIPVAILNSPFPGTGFTGIVDTSQYFDTEIIEQTDLTVEEGLEIIASFGSLTHLEELAQSLKKL